MPANEAGQGAQADTENAGTPKASDTDALQKAQASDKETTKGEEQGAEGKGQIQIPNDKAVMDHLGIPPELQAQIAPAAETAATTPAEEQGEQREEQGAETETDEDEEEEQEQEQEEKSEGQRPDKRDKRINRLTRQKHELTEQLDTAVSELEKLREERQSQTAATEQSIPIGRGRLSHIATERELGQEIAKAEAVIEWCDANTEGATTGEGDKEKFISPEEVTKWRREAEKIVLIAPNRRDEIRTFNSTRTHFDGLAQQAWPELFDKGTKEYQLASSILNEFPTIKTSPQAKYAVGLVIEGMRALQGRAQGAEGKGQRQNGEKTRRDISPRAFEPRVPIAPHTANPPSRPADAGSSSN
jgi:hypothetical protein